MKRGKYNEINFKKSNYFLNLNVVTESEKRQILKNISKEGKIVIVVCHNEKIKDYCDHLYEIVDGSLECRL